jgi:ubiquinone biosynthesis monooxygenase Coq7
MLTPLILGFDRALRTLSGTAMPSLMRINHTGEVCAQALYSAQSLVARDPEIRERYARAAREEEDHLAWTQSRLAEMEARPSLLNPLWYGGSFAIGLAAGMGGDRGNLGFVVETERQVEEHLTTHMDRLPAADLKSRAIVEQMRDDEARHGAMALEAGGLPLPFPIRRAMRAAADVMRAVAYRI